MRAESSLVFADNSWIRDDQYWMSLKAQLGVSEKKKTDFFIFFSNLFQIRFPMWISMYWTIFYNVIQNFFSRNRFVIYLKINLYQSLVKLGWRRSAKNFLKLVLGICLFLLAKTFVPLIKHVFHEYHYWGSWYPAFVRRQYLY